MEISSSEDDVTFARRRLQEGADLKALRAELAARGSDGVLGGTLLLASGALWFWHRAHELASGGAGTLRAPMALCVLGGVLMARGALPSSRG